MKQILASGAAMAAALALTAPANATIYFSGGVTAQSPSGLTPVTDFTAPGGTKVDVLVQDCCVVGDYYATYVDGGYIGTTPYEPPFGSSSGFPNSQATFVTTLGAGSSHNFQLADQWFGDLPAGAFVEISSAVPEPAAWSMMLIGVFGIGAALRTRRSRLTPDVQLT
ncbi:MAG TPA: PEP-CTERM sorting domain-containing protein [Caulobacteraceae bacterium]|nr:PEP-CTERM sorting domain-containing protein [Caulobacteraceae bacterium]